MQKSSLLALSLLAATNAWAQSPPVLRDLTSVRAAGMGGATRGFASSEEALLVNPAGIAGTARFNIDGTGMLGVDNGLRVLSASSIDSALNAEDSFPLSGGAGYYNYRSGEGDARRTGSLVAVALALPLDPETFFVGVTGKWLKLSGAVETNAVTMDAGVLVRPVPIIGLSAVGYNLVDVDSPEAQRSWGFGVSIGTDTTFHLAGDLRLDRKDGKQVFSYFAGGEYLLSDRFVPRAGFIEDKFRDAREVTGGLTVLFEGFAVDAAYNRALEGEGQVFGLALRLLESPF